MLSQTSSLANPGAVPSRHTVLVPVDFSSCSRAALLRALDYSNLVDAHILVLHVAHETVGESGSYRKNDASNPARTIEMIAADMLEKFIEGVINNQPLVDNLVSARRMVVQGLPATRIQEIAEREKAACIIMGTHGRVGLPRLALGSVAEKVVRHSNIPVTIVKDFPAGSEKSSLV